jgi:diguanylate cyclase (GGDEF)-like protein
MTPTRPPSQANLVVEYVGQERNRFAEQRRKVYITVGSIGMLLLLYDIYSQIAQQLPHHNVYVINDTVFAVFSLVLMCLAYSRRTKIDTLERVAFVFLALESFVFNTLAPYLFDFPLQEVFTQTITDDVWLLVLVCALALHIFQRWWGLVVAVGFYVLSLAVTSSYIFLHLAGNDEVRLASLTLQNLASLTLQNYAAGAMVLCFLYVLARYRDSVQSISLQYELLEKVAFLDALTGLPNRRRMYDVMQQQLELATRYGTPFCIALIDIDHFKRINDAFGHLKGDEVLKQVADVLRSDLRAADQLGRWGGEEFLLVLPQTTLKEALAAAERSRQAIELHMGLASQPITISCGVTCYLPTDVTTTLVGRADDALYHAKENGRNKVVSSEAVSHPLVTSSLS